MRLDAPGRRMHALLLLVRWSKPRSCLQMYERAVVLRQQVGALELIAGLYNGIQRTLVPVEQPLLEPRMAAVQAALAKGLLVRGDVSDQCMQAACARGSARRDALCQLPRAVAMHTLPAALPAQGGAIHSMMSSAAE